MYIESYTSERIKKRRDEFGLTQEALAERVNGKDAARTQIAKWEKGGAMPNTSSLLRLCNALECDIDYLLGAIPTPRKATYDVMEQTGLTEKAVDMITACSAKGHISILSRLIESVEFWQALDYMNRAVYSQKGIDTPMSDTLQEQVLCLEMVNMVERHPGATIPTAEQVRDMNIYHASQKFGECIGEIVDEMAKQNRPSSER